MFPWPFVFYGAVIALLRGAGIRRRLGCVKAWRMAADAAGLQHVRLRDGFLGASLVGQAGALQIHLETYSDRAMGSGTRIAVSPLGGGELLLRREGVGTELGKRVLGIREIVIGSPTFDAEIYVQGKESTVRAILDAKTRLYLARLLGEGVLVRSGKEIAQGVERASVANGVLQLDVPDVTAEAFAEVFCATLDLARRLLEPPDVARRLAENLRTERVAGARLAALVVLAREFPEHPATCPALLAALSDASAEVRLHAAMALGEQGRETLLALVANEATDDSCAARAVAALGEQLPGDESVRVLRRALAAGHAETAIACLEAVGVAGGAEREGALLEALQSPLDDVRITAARALGRAGTVAAIPELLRAYEAGPAELGRAARRAVAEIQSRLPGASPGQLSLAEGEAGQLSLSDGEAGRLSLTPPAKE